MLRFSSKFLILATLAAFAACTTAGGSSRSDARPASVPSSVLTEAEITRAGAGTAYEAVERLRPWYMFRTRARGASCDLAVYVDGVRLGGLSALHGIPSTSVWQIRFLGGFDATTRFGNGHCAGAMVVVTRVGR